jgi:hypothetical protein
MQNLGAKTALEDQKCMALKYSGYLCLCGKNRLQ